jgi:hypothetical protein
MEADSPELARLRARITQLLELLREQAQQQK